MTTKYFELDKVESMTLTTEKETDYKWFEEVAPTFKTFLGFKYDKKPLTPAGWSDYSDGWGRVQLSYFDRWDSYRVDELNKKVYNKSTVTLYLGGDNRISTNFNSDKEAEDYVNELMEEAMQEFHYIEIK
jgi:hypothetical protein